MTDFSWEWAGRLILDNFRKSEADGYRSRDRQYAIEILAKAEAAALAAIVAPHWQPIETAPKDGSPVVTLSPRRPPNDAGWYHPTVLYFRHGLWRTSPEKDPLNVCYAQPTHWMPLPLQPVAHPQTEKA